MGQNASVKRRTRNIGASEWMRIVRENERLVVGLFPRGTRSYNLENRLRILVESIFPRVVYEKW